MKSLFLAVPLLVGFSHTVFAAAVSPTSSSYSVTQSAGINSLHESNVFTFPTTGGAIPSSITANNVYPIGGGGSGSIASAAVTAALGVGAAAAGLFSSPAVVGSLVALQVGMVGYNFYQSMASSGVAFSPSGSASVSSYGDIPCATALATFNAWGTSLGYHPTAAEIASSCSYASAHAYVMRTSHPSCPVMWSPGQFYDYLGYSAVCVHALVTPTQSAATNQDIVNAINASTASASASLDALSFAISQGVNVRALVPDATTNAGTSPAPLVEPEALVSTTVDALGATTRVTEQKTTTLTSPANAGSPSTASQVVTTKTYSNSDPLPFKTTVNTSVPVVASPVSTSSSAPSVVPAINIPNDYNRESTQAKIADSLAVTPSTIPLGSESSDISALTGDFGGIPVMNRGALAGTVSLPSSGACVPIDMMISGVHFAADPCPIINYLHPLVNYLFIFLFGILNLRAALKNDEFMGAI